MQGAEINYIERVGEISAYSSSKIECPNIRNIAGKYMSDY
jgi:hypothetical protein